MPSPDLIPVDSALEAFELDPAHRPLVRQIALRAGIVGCEVKASYVKAIRIDGMHPLHVTHRGVEWFSSQVEAVSASGLPEQVRGKVNRAGTENWAVTFPKAVPAVGDDAGVAPVLEHAAEAPAAQPAGAAVAMPAAKAAATPAVKPKPVERDHGVCETCWQARTASGSCGCED